MDAWSFELKPYRSWITSLSMEDGSRILAGLDHDTHLTSSIKVVLHRVSSSTVNSSFALLIKSFDMFSFWNITNTVWNSFFVVCISLSPCCFPVMSLQGSSGQKLGRRNLLVVGPGPSGSSVLCLGLLTYEHHSFSSLNCFQSGDNEVVIWDSTSGTSTRRVSASSVLNSATSVLGCSSPARVLVSSDINSSSISDTGGWTEPLTFLRSPFWIWMLALRSSSKGMLCWRNTSTRSRSLCISAFSCCRRGNDCRCNWIFWIAFFRLHSAASLCHVSEDLPEALHSRSS